MNDVNPDYVVDDLAEAARVILRTPADQHELILDLRYRSAHASGGLFPQNGVAGNLPSGETYIVPYEGERTGEPSLSGGELPVQIGDERVRSRRPPLFFAARNIPFRQTQNS